MLRAPVLGATSGSARSAADAPGCSAAVARSPAGGLSARLFWTCMTATRRFVVLEPRMPAYHGPLRLQFPRKARPRAGRAPAPPARPYREGAGAAGALRRIESGARRARRAHGSQALFRAALF